MKTWQRKWPFQPYLPIPEVVEDWMDPDDVDFIERVRRTGNVDNVYSWTESVSKPYSYHEVQRIGFLSWEEADHHVINAGRSNSAFFTNAQIEARAKEREQRKEWVRQFEEAERQRKNREARNERARYLRRQRREALEREINRARIKAAQLKAAAEREERDRERLTDEQAWQEFHKMSELIYKIQSLMATPHPVKPIWTVENLAFTIGADKDQVRAAVRKLVNAGFIKVTP